MIDNNKKTEIMIHEIFNPNNEVIAVFKVQNPLVKEYEKLGYKLTLDNKGNGKPGASAYPLNSKASFPKPLFNYYFGSEERREQYVKEQLENLKSIKRRKEERMTAKKEARANMVNPYKVGEIYYDSWGYEQTNIDFYQVVEVKEKSVVIRSIGGEMVPGTAGYMCCNVRPVKDRFIGQPIVKHLQVQVSYDGKATYYIKSKHGSISLYDRGEKGVYESHYA
jgi:hypothetical protein